MSAFNASDTERERVQDSTRPRRVAICSKVTNPIDTAAMTEKAVAGSEEFIPQYFPACAANAVNTAAAIVSAREIFRARNSERLSLSAACDHTLCASQAHVT